MKLKSYFSGTVEAALELARRELGEEALLVNARPATPETRHLGAYEVVFGLASRSDASRSDAPLKDASRSGSPLKDASRSDANQKDASHGGAGTGAAPPSPSLPAAPAVDRLAGEVADLKRQLERITQMLAAPPSGLPGPALPSPQREGMYPHLIAQDLDATLAEAAAQGTPFEELLGVDSTLGVAGLDRAVVALVGPPGAGKTTTLVKLAARYGLQARKPAQIISTDVYRIAAADQLRSLAAILGIGFQIAETTGALAQMLEEHASKQLVLIDTPGLAPTEMEDAAELAQFIAANAEIDTHLVLPASMRAADMSRTIHQFSVFGPKKLLFTHIDETCQYGTAASQAARSMLPVSFLSTGQQIPDDLEPASHVRLAELLFGSRPAAAQSKGAAA